jgi:hypothetical protein
MRKCIITIMIIITVTDNMDASFYSNIWLKHFLIVEVNLIN